MTLRLSTLAHLPSSNIPLVVNIFKLFNGTNIISVRFSKKFLPLSLSFKTILPLLFALFTTVIRVCATLNWLARNWMITQPPIPNWKYVLVGYTGFLHGVITIGLLHIERVRKEIVTLLNACVDTELQLILEGGPGYVHRYFVTLSAIVASSFVLVPCAVSVMSFFQPCMPPVITSTMILNCKNCSHSGAVGLAMKLVLGIYEFYTGIVVIGSVGIGVYIVLLYPIEVKLFILDYIERKEMQTKPQARGYHLYKYRVLQLISTYHDNTWCQPSVPVTLGGISVAETVSLYVLVTSHDRFPIIILLMFLMVALDCFVVIHSVCKIVAKPYSKSCNFIEFMKIRNLSKWVKYFMRSCRPSKFSMGDGTFFDRLTSFVLWQKCIDLLITLLLM
ncbi:hypothetical protein Fcan01_26586 [Folsomia candida]|uniref:Uncharacterized protein n=1 Tax=Folsomia candida TaxID=158441 RepID=A0A226D0D0_FOLCA|nr:hypothetical protein Fcan01_26586 [Folsomia candida]